MDGLTKKQRGFVKDYIETGNGTQAALKNYDIQSDNPERVASVIAAENLTKPSIINAIQSIAEKIPDELLAERHLELLNKREKVTRINTDGTLTEHDVGPDVAGVSKGLDMAYKIKGIYAPEKSVNLNLDVSVTDPKALALAKEYEDKIKQGL